VQIKAITSKRTPIGPYCRHSVIKASSACCCQPNRKAEATIGENRYLVRRVELAERQRVLRNVKERQGTLRSFEKQIEEIANVHLCC
jgi:hypothetical protein